MSLYTLTPRPGFERYTIQVGWNPHRTYFATMVDLTGEPAIDSDNQPDSLQLGRLETILDPSKVLQAVEPYAVIPADLPAALRTDQATHPVRRSQPLGTAGAPTPASPPHAAPSTPTVPPSRPTATPNGHRTARRSPTTIQVGSACRHHRQPAAARRAQGRRTRGRLRVRLRRLHPAGPPVRRPPSPDRHRRRPHHPDPPHSDLPWPRHRRHGQPTRCPHLDIRHTRRSDLRDRPAHRARLAGAPPPARPTRLTAHHV